jgi:hypothetical protein
MFVEFAFLLSIILDFLLHHNDSAVLRCIALERNAVWRLKQQAASWGQLQSLHVFLSSSCFLFVFNIECSTLESTECYFLLKTETVQSIGSWHVRHQNCRFPLSLRDPAISWNRANQSRMWTLKQLVYCVRLVEFRTYLMYAAWKHQSVWRSLYITQ